MSQLTTNTTLLQDVLDKVNALEPPRPAGEIEYVEVTLVKNENSGNLRQPSARYFGADLKMGFETVTEEGVTKTVLVVKNSVIWLQCSMGMFFNNTNSNFHELYLNSPGVHVGYVTGDITFGH